MHSSRMYTNFMTGTRCQYRVVSFHPISLQRRLTLECVPPDRRCLSPKCVPPERGLPQECQSVCLAPEYLPPALQRRYNDIKTKTFPHLRWRKVLISLTFSNSETVIHETVQINQIPPLTSKFMRGQGLILTGG